MTEAGRIVRRTRGSLGGESLVLIAVAKMKRSEDCLLMATVEGPCWRMGLGRRLPTYPREAAGLPGGNDMQVAGGLRLLGDGYAARVGLQEVAGSSMMERAVCFTS